jgi:hypothetical protein
MFYRVQYSIIKLKEYETKLLLFLKCSVLMSKTDCTSFRINLGF